MAKEDNLILLKHEESPLLKKFQEAYLTDPLKARIFAMTEPIHSFEMVVWEQSEHKFQIVHRRISYGVSVTMKMFVRYKKVRVVTVNNGKFHFFGDNGLINRLSINTPLETEAWKYLTEKYSWIRMLKEYNFPIIFNSIVRHRLYDTRKCYRYIYKCKPDKAKLLHDCIKSGAIYSPSWKLYTKSVSNLDNLNPELLAANTTIMMLNDACFMALKLCKKVNMAWSVARLKQEHDEWSKYITEVVYEMSNRELKIQPVFKALAETLSGLLTTTKELAIEGQKQSHCVATYASAVDSGRCAIWHIEGYTAEIATDNNKKLFLKQFLGYKNTRAPESLSKLVHETLDEFNKNIESISFRSLANAHPFLYQAVQQIEQPYITPF